MLDTEKLAKKAKRLLEVATEEGLNLSYEQAIALVTLNPTKQARTLIKLAITQYNLTADAAVATAPEAASTKTEKSAKAKAGTKAKADKTQADTTQANKALADKAVGKTKGQTTKATKAQKTEKAVAKPQPEVFSFSAADLATIADFFLGQDFIDEHNKLVDKVKVEKKELWKYYHLCNKLEAVDDPVAFFSDLVDKVNRHLKKAAKGTAPLLTARDLIRVKMTSSLL